MRWEKNSVESFQPTAVKSIHQGAFSRQDFIGFFVFKSIKNEFFFPYRHALFPLFLKSRGRRKLFQDCIVMYAFAFLGTTEGNLEDKSLLTIITGACLVVTERRNNLVKMKRKQAKVEANRFS